MGSCDTLPVLPGRALAGELNQQWQRPGGRGDAFGARAEQFDVATGQPFAFIKVPAFG
jgi:hypothetical protein